ncbi:MAG: carbohydrate-binding domain-containing protein [Clostridia bacterium]|nr:carbohydrate-binding domain-containing protein [Clostridia bacterium]
MKLKKMVCVIVLTIMLLSSLGVPSMAQEVTVKIDEEKLNCTTPARIENGSTMVPMRAIFEALGMSVEWNNEEKSVTATKEGKVIKLVIGKKTLQVNGEEVELNVAPFIENGSTMVPVRAVSESVDAKVEWKGDKYTVEITTAEYEENKDKWKDNTGVIDVGNMTVSGSGVNVDGNVVYITEGGDFSLKGENDNVMIHVDTKYKVKLRLEGVKMSNPSNPVIFFENTNKSFITISKGTENYITDGEEYTALAKAAIFSNDDIEIKGEGTLYVTSKAHHALASDDDIKIEEGTLLLTADTKDGIHANNTVKILGGDITVTAKGDGIQAEEDVVIEDGNINVTTTGEVAESFGNWGGGMPQGGFGGGRGWRDRNNQTTEGVTPPEGMTRPEGFVPNGEMTAPEGMMRPEGFAPNGEMTPPEGMTPPQGFEPPEGFNPEGGMMQPENENTTAPEDEATATKGIKGETNVTITGGNIVVNSADHAIHCAGTLNITGGELSLSSEKGKGISAHGDVYVESGKIDILKATEGLESKANLTINGGEINIKGSDDGINAGGTGGRDVANRNNSEATTGHDLVITGGTIFVNASGDGLDANGRMIIEGGSIIVEGPTNSGNGALDSGGVIKVNGGTMIALGASGMAEVPDNDSLQPSFRLVVSENIAAGSNIVIKNAAGEVLYSYTTIKTGNSIVFSSDKLTVGETYTVTIGESVHTVELGSVVTNVGNGNGFGFGGRRW